ncbi:MAG: rRNA maturation RNase YbeY [Bdellovibrionota bacterium]
MKRSGRTKTNRILVQDTRPQSARKKDLEATLLRALHILGLSHVEISVAIVDDQQIQELNREYRNKDKPTDVLSFSQDEHMDGWRFLGDIIISKETTVRQAREKNQRIKDEYRLLAIHGLLHLLGYDHVTLQQEKVMFALQGQLLDEIQQVL